MAVGCSGEPIDNERLQNEQMKVRLKMDWYKVFMWIASICAFTALAGERFLPQIAVVALAFVGIAILVVIVVFLMDEE